MISDEKLDLENEDMISKLLTRIDVERISPIMEHIKDIKACAARIEARVHPSGTG